MEYRMPDGIEIDNHNVRWDKIDNLMFCPLPNFGKQLVFSNWIDSMQKMIM